MRSSPENASPLKVLVVSNHWKKKDNKTFGGVWVDRQVTALRNLGVEIHTYDIGTSHHPLHLWKQWRALRDQVKRVKPHVIHARYGSITAFLCAFSGAPLLITFAGSDLLVGAGVSWWRVALGITLSNLAALRAQALICVSRELRDALWWRNEKATVIPDGVNLEAFQPFPKSEARTQLGWPQDTKVVVMDGARDPINKGLHVAEAAMVGVQKEWPGAQLKIFTGIQPQDMPLHYAAADVLLCASRQEGSPNVVKEALACNCPVVATDVGDVRERLAHVEPSAIVCRTPEDIAAGIIRMFQLNQRSNGREHVRELSIDRIAERVVAIYRHVAGRVLTLKTGMELRRDSQKPGCARLEEKQRVSER